MEHLRHKKHFYPFAVLSETAPGLLYSIALHLRDSPTDVFRRPSEKKRSSFPSRFGDVPFQLPDLLHPCSGAY